MFLSKILSKSKPTMNLVKASRATCIILESDFYKIKGRGEVDVFMVRNDAKAMKHLLDNMKNQCDHIHKDENEDVYKHNPFKLEIKDKKTMHMDSLEHILLKHGIKDSEKVRETLFRWKQEC